MIDSTHICPKFKGINLNKVCSRYGVVKTNLPGAGVLTCNWPVPLWKRSLAQQQLRTIWKNLGGSNRDPETSRSDPLHPSPCPDPWFRALASLRKSEELTDFYSCVFLCVLGTVTCGENKWSLELQVVYTNVTVIQNAGKPTTQQIVYCIFMIGDVCFRRRTSCQSVPGALPQRVKLTATLCPVTSFKTAYTLPPLSHASWWRGSYPHSYCSVLVTVEVLKLFGKIRRLFAWRRYMTRQLLSVKIHLSLTLRWIRRLLVF